MTEVKDLRKTLEEQTNGVVIGGSRNVSLHKDGQRATVMRDGVTTEPEMKTVEDVCEAILAEVESYSKKNTNPSADEKAELDRIHKRIIEINDEENVLMDRKEALHKECNTLRKRRRMIEWGK